MKTKLLKKLRKRYNWYFKEDKFPVLIDNYKKEVIVYDLEHCCYLNKIKLENVNEEVEVNHDEWALRILKRHLLSKYGWNMQREWYRKAVIRYKSRLTK